MSKNTVITVEAARSAGQAIKQVAQSLQGLSEREAVEGALAVSFERLALIGQMSAVLNQPPACRIFPPHSVAAASPGCRL